MSSKYLVDPEQRGLIEMAPFDLSMETLPAVRRRMTEALLKAPSHVPDDIAYRQEMIGGPLGPQSLAVFVCAPKTSKAMRPAYLDIHGGGFVLGNAAMRGARNFSLARDMDCVVVSVDYRLAPETVFPGALEDCYAALQWLHENAAGLGIDRSRVAVGGDSAGGGLAAALAILARDRGAFSIVHLQLTCPMLDDRQPETPHRFTGEFVWRSADSRFGWECMLGGPAGGPDVSAYAAPARAEDLTKLPSTFLAVGALDLFLEENIEYVRRLAQAGVAVEFHLYPGTVHGFQLAGGQMGKLHNQLRMTALERAFARSGHDESNA